MGGCRATRIEIMDKQFLGSLLRIFCSLTKSVDASFGEIRAQILSANGKSLLESKEKRTKIGKGEQNQPNSAITNHFVVLNHRVISCNSFSALSVSTHKLLQ